MLIAGVTRVPLAGRFPFRSWSRPASLSAGSFLQTASMRGSVENMVRHLRDVSAGSPAYTPEIRREQMLATPLAVRLDLTFSTLRLSRLHCASWTDPDGGKHEVSCHFLEMLMNLLDMTFAKPPYSALARIVSPPQGGM
jgi:hypothetical protein